MYILCMLVQYYLPAWHIIFMALYTHFYIIYTFLSRQRNMITYMISNGRHHIKMSTIMFTIPSHHIIINSIVCTHTYDWAYCRGDQRGSRLPREYRDPASLPTADSPVDSMNYLVTD